MPEDYETVTYKNYKIKSQLQEEAKELQRWVESLSDKDNKYILHSPWGHNLIFAKEKINGTFHVTEPLLKFSTTLSRENFEGIKEEINGYFEELRWEKECGEKSAEVEEASCNVSCEECDLPF